MDELKKMVDNNDWEGLAHYFRTVSCKDCVLNAKINCCAIPTRTCTEIFLEFTKGKIL